MADTTCCFCYLQMTTSMVTSRVRSVPGVHLTVYKLIFTERYRVQLLASITAALL